ncbi:unnamed protein product, partial [Notodromas monacha]
EQQLEWEVEEPTEQDPRTEDQKPLQPMMAVVKRTTQVSPAASTPSWPPPPTSGMAATKAGDKRQKETPKENMQSDPKPCPGKSCSPDGLGPSFVLGCWQRFVLATPLFAALNLVLARLFVVEASPVFILWEKSMGGRLACEDICEVRRPALHKFQVDFVGDSLDLDCIRYKGLKEVRLFNRTFCSGKALGMEEIVRPWSHCFFKHTKKQKTVKEESRISKPIQKTSPYKTSSTTPLTSSTVPVKQRISTTSQPTTIPWEEETATIQDQDISVANKSDVTVEPETQLEQTVGMVPLEEVVPVEEALPKTTRGTLADIAEESKNLSISQLNISAGFPDGSVIHAEFPQWLLEALRESEAENQMEEAPQSVLNPLFEELEMTEAPSLATVRSEALSGEELLARWTWPLLRAWVLAKICSSHPTFCRTQPGSGQVQFGHFSSSRSSGSFSKEQNKQV